MTSPPAHLRRFAELDPAQLAPGSLGLVWGNCQAESIRRMIAPAGARAGVEFVRIPPVYEMDAAGVAALHALLPGAGVLVTQPVADEYRVPGCGSEQLIALLGPAARVVRVPTTYYEGLFPWQVHAHDEHGARVEAPVTDYHDLRLLDAAVRGWDVPAAVDRLLIHEPPADAVRELAAASRAELRRRTADLDVDSEPAVAAAGAGAMHTVNHPANAVLREVGAGVLDTLGWDGEPAVPDHEMLGASRAPLEAAVLAALELDPGRARRTWLRDGEPLDWAAVAGPQLELYARRPELAAGATRRYASRLAALAISG